MGSGASRRPEQAGGAASTLGPHGIPAVDRAGASRDPSSRPIITLALSSARAASPWQPWPIPARDPRPHSAGVHILRRHPVTVAGKIIAAIVAILGLGMFALPTGILGADFVDEMQKQRRPAETCPHCGKELPG